MEREKEKKTNADNSKWKVQNSQVSGEYQRERESEKLRLNYSRSIYEEWASKEEQVVLASFLERQEVNAKLRAKMVDWMVEVLHSYKCREQSFFVAVHILDSYLSLLAEPLPVSQLHLAGVVAMWIATKYEEIYPLRLKTLHEKIAHSKLSLQAIKEKETHIL